MRLGLSIHHTIVSNSSCLETSVRMVYCVAFNCNANSSKNRVICSWFKFPMGRTLFLKNKLQASFSHSRKLVPTAIRTREDGSPGLSCC